MEILSAIVTENNINLESDTPFSRLVLSHGKKLENTYEETGLNTTSIEITKEVLGLDNLNNIYFIIQIYNNLNEEDEIGAHNIEVTNNNETKLYDARYLKNDLDNLNYYDNILESLEYKSELLAANDFFFNYINFLEKKLNGNNFLQSIGRQD